MQGEERTITEAPSVVSVPRVLPSSSFAQDLGSELRRAAQQHIQCVTQPQLSEVVQELRKLVQLLRRTLVPVYPNAVFREELGERLLEESIELAVARQQRWRWLMVGGVVGSAVSLAGVVTAVLIRKRNGHGPAKKPLIVA